MNITDAIVLCTALVVPCALYLGRLAILTKKADDDSYLEDLEDRVGALESMAEEVGSAQEATKAMKTAVLALEEKLEIEKLANNRANNNILQKLNKHEMQLGATSGKSR